MMDARAAIAERFWAKVDRWDPDECWEWTAAKLRAGYGVMGGRLLHDTYGERFAHRISYLLNIGPIPEGMQLDHLCRNTGCVNPKHLEPVTNYENNLRGTGLIARARWTHCPRGHEFTEANTLRPKDGRRRCRTCHNAAVRRAYHQRVQILEIEETW